MLGPILAFLAKRDVVVGLGLTALCVWTADLVSLGIKEAARRPRPFEALEGVDSLVGTTLSHSLPSGHAATSFAGAVVLTYLLPRAAPFVFLLATAIAFSRIYVGVHYPSDVLLGALLGAVVALAVLSLVRLRRRTAGAPPRSEAEPPAG